MLSIREFAASAALVATLTTAAACGASQSSSTPKGVWAASCSGARGSHHAWVIVQNQDRGEKRCVGFDTPTITALNLTRRGGIGVATQSFSFGLAVCQVDHQPPHYSQCLPANGSFWALFTAAGGGAWRAAATSADTVQVHDAGAIGWRYDPVTAPNPQPPDLKPA